MATKRKTKTKTTQPPEGLTEAVYTRITEELLEERVREIVGAKIQLLVDASINKAERELDQDKTSWAKKVNKRIQTLIEEELTKAAPKLVREAARCMYISTG